MSIREFIELILDANGGDWVQTKDDIDNFFVQFKLSAYQLVAEFEEFALENNKCPNCGSDLEYEAYEEDRGEFQGFECKEIMHECYCPKCDYGDDE